MPTIPLADAELRHRETKCFFSGYKGCLWQSEAQIPRLMPLPVKRLSFVIASHSSKW